MDTSKRLCSAMTIMSDFDQFVYGPIAMGDVTETMQMWRGEYASTRLGGWTALHWACEYTSGDREGVVWVLLDRGCDIEAEADTGWRPLHLCASSDNREAIRALLEARCCLTARTRQGETPLQIAERNNHHECASMLRMAMQTKEVSEPLELLKNNSLSNIVEPQTGKTLLDKLLNSNDERALEAIKAKQLDEQEIKEWKYLKLNEVDSQSLQSLHECLMYRCIHQKYDCWVYSLCTADIVNKASLFMGPTALETAVDCGAVVWVHEILRKLVKVDESWLAAEEIARKKNLSDIPELISKRRNYLIRKAKKGFSRLHIAVIENDSDMVEYLINKGLVTADETHKNFGTALSLAYSIDNIDCVQSLHSCKVNVNTVDRFMQTPLHVAISNKTEDLCEYLVDHTRNIECMDIFGVTPLVRSVLNDCRDICERLVKKGAVCINDVELMPQLSDVPTDLSIKSSNIPIISLTSHETVYSLCLKSNRTIYPCLLEAIDLHSINRPDGRNNSLLHLSAVLLMPDLCSQLIIKTAVINVKNSSERTPLLELLKQHDEENMNEIEAEVIATVNVLIEGGASLDVEDIDGCSILEKATGYHNEKLLLALIHKCEHIDRINEPVWLAWIFEKHYTMIREVITRINKSLLNEWITRDLIKDRLVDGDICLAKLMYDNGTYEIKTDVVESMLYKAAVIGDKDLFKNIIKDDLSETSALDGGESLLNWLIRERKVEFIQLLIRSRNGSWFMEKKNVENKLPLHVCIECDFWDILDQLILETSSVNEEDVDGNTSVSLLLTKISLTEDEALIGRLMTFVKLLIKNGANIYMVNKLEKSVISCCTKSEQKLDIESFYGKQQPRHETAVPQQGTQPAEVTPPNICTICEDEPKNCALICGHMFCMTCAEKTIDCYICRRRITDRIKLFV